LEIERVDLIKEKEMTVRGSRVTRDEVIAIAQDDITHAILEREIGHSEQLLFLLPKES
jgi:hypothetical protein